MFEAARDLLLRLLRVPPEPAPPAGAPESVRVFRAGRNFFRLSLLKWIAAQLVALAGIVFWTAVLIAVDGAARARRDAPATIVPPAVASAEAAADDAVQPPKSKSKPARKRAPAVRVDSWAGFKKSVVDVALLLPPWAFPLIWTVKLGGILLYLAQIPFTYAVRRLDYEMRWYVVTDRSLRLRSGVWSVREMTMSFANLQQITVAQGPLQRLLGLADVKVQSAGGGAVQGRHDHGHQSLHTGFFHAVDNAEEVRDLIVERLRRFRETGLGDPDELSRRAGRPTAPADRPELAAAKGLLAEARALRTAFR